MSKFSIRPHDLCKQCIEAYKPKNLELIITSGHSHKKGLCAVQFLTSASRYGVKTTLANLCS